MSNLVFLGYENIDIMGSRSFDAESSVVDHRPAASERLVILIASLLITLEKKHMWQVLTETLPMGTHNLEFL